MGICDTFGLPSTHAQVLAFSTAAYAVLAVSIKNSSKLPLQSVLQVLESIGLVVLTVAVMFARVYLGYHTWSQVIIGALVGLGSGCVFTIFSVWLLRTMKKGPVSILSLGSLGLRNDICHQRNARMSTQNQKR